MVLIVGAALLLVIPFGRKRQETASLPSADQKTIAPLVSYVEANYQSPADYVAGSFASHDIVFLGEYGKVRQNVQLVADLIPKLYTRGVRELGFEYALSADQPLIDRLTTGPSFDENLAKKILFDYLVIWGYQEYSDVFKAAWSFNRSLPRGAKPFRIVGLSVAQDWQYIRTKQDADKPEILHKVFANGIPDVRMAQTIEKEILANGEKALIYADIRSSFTRYHNKGYAENMLKMGFSETERAGNLIYDKIGDRSFTILLHQPWPSATSSLGAVYPAGGLIDNVIAKLPSDRREAGFNVRGTPFGRIPLTASDFSKGYSSLTLGDLCDGYVLQGKLSSYQAVTPIADFVTEGNLADAIREFPGPKVENLKPSNLNGFISGNLENLTRFLGRFQ